MNGNTMDEQSPSEAKDTYGYEVDPKIARHAKCDCPVPCQKRFRCRSRHHLGDRKTPYCIGGEGESCNDCWLTERLRSSRPTQGKEPMTKRICNWCARVSDDQAPERWTRLTLRIDGLDDGSISWLPEKTLDFCLRPDCALQVGRVVSFLRDLPEDGAVPPLFAEPSGLRVRLTTWDSDVGDLPSLVRRFAYPDAAEDLRALARFFHETSHPRLRRVLEAFEASP